MQIRKINFLNDKLQKTYLLHINSCHLGLETSGCFLIVSQFETFHSYFTVGEGSLGSKGEGGGQRKSYWVEE